MSPLVVVGLGNPGPRYARTRHNVGFDLVDRLAERLGLRWRSPLFRPVMVARTGGLILVKPLTFMNRSGTVFPYVLRRYRCSPDALCVVLDNMDLPAGEVRIKQRGGTAGHNGLKSVASVLGTDDYLRLYIGIGRPSEAGTTIDHVIGEFDPEQRIVVDRAIDRVAPVFEACSDYSREQLISTINERRRE